MTCTRAEWSVEHGCFYLTVSVPMPYMTPLVVRDVTMRIDNGEIRITPPPSVDWPNEWTETAQAAATKHLWTRRAPNTKKATLT